MPSKLSQFHFIFRDSLWLSLTVKCHSNIFKPHLMLTWYIKESRIYYTKTAASIPLWATQPQFDSNGWGPVQCQSPPEAFPGSWSSREWLTMIQCWACKSLQKLSKICSFVRFWCLFLRLFSLTALSFPIFVLNCVILCHCFFVYSFIYGRWFVCPVWEAPKKEVTAQNSRSCKECGHDIWRGFD